MDAEKLNDVANSLALCAVTGDRTGLVKIASEYTKESAGIGDYLANPYVRNALLGAGAGGLVGMLQGKRKLRNALTYGLVGALGGAGFTPLLNRLGEAAKPSEPAPGADNGPAVTNIEAAREYVGKGLGDPNAWRLGGRMLGGIGGFRAGYQGTVGALKNRSALQNLADVETNAANARNWRGAPLPTRVTSDTLAARAALDPVRNSLQEGAPPAQRQAIEAAIRRNSAGGAARTIDRASRTVDRGVPSAFEGRRVALQSLSDAASAVEANNAAAAGAPVRATPSANQLSRAFREANRLAPTTWKQRAAGTAGGLGLGYLGSLLTGALGENAANMANSSLRQKAFGQ